MYQFWNCESKSAKVYSEDLIFVWRSLIGIAYVKLIFRSFEELYKSRSALRRYTSAYVMFWKCKYVWCLFSSFCLRMYIVKLGKREKVSLLSWSLSKRAIKSKLNGISCRVLKNKRKKNIKAKRNQVALSKELSKKMKIPLMYPLTAVILMTLSMLGKCYKSTIKDNQ